MSLESVVLTVLITLSGVLAARLIYSSICGFSVRTPNDVFPFLLSIDLEALNGSFHPEVEDNFRDILSPEEFRETQWKRIHLAIHYCNMVSNNARVFLGWTKYERGENWELLDSDLQEAVLSLRDVCAQCRLSSFVIRLRLRWWLVRMEILPFLQPPTFKILLPLGSADMVTFYKNAKSLAEAFSRVYGSAYHQKLVQAL
jgi:hypothetical protein